MILTPPVTRSSAACCAASAGTASTPAMMFFSRIDAGSSSYALTVTFPTGSPTLPGSLSKTAAMLMPGSAKMGELAIAWPSRPAADDDRPTRQQPLDCGELDDLLR